MSVTGIASSILAELSGLQHHHSRGQQVQSEFQQLGQDLQSGNLAQAQSDFTTLSQNLPGLNQASTAATTSANSNPIAQAFTQLGQDLQSGNLQSAQADFTTIQKDAQQSIGQQIQGHHGHRHHAENSQDSATSQQTNSIDQAFAQLAQTLQGGNLQGAQSAFATLVNDLQQIGGIVTSGASSVAVSATTGGLSVSA